MRLKATPISGAYVIDLSPREDDRGFFSRLFCADTFRQHGLNPCVAQQNMSFNYRAGTIRGLHYQAAPATEAKLMRCTRGAIFDVIVDLRPGSETYQQWFGIELSEANRLALYVPELFAHGYQALMPGTEVIYHASTAYSPEHERGIRPDDPALAITWPLPPSDVSAKDASWPLLIPEMAGATQ
jgi:dTDP-4-dehydrorhamnose 3,5-epimerase